MEGSLFELLREIDKSLARMTPDIWFDIVPGYDCHGIANGATLVNYDESVECVWELAELQIRMEWIQLKWK